MEVSAIQEHYIKNRQKLAKKMGFRAGSPEAGEDVVQTAYERALRYRKTCDSEGFDRWFSTVLNNSLRDYKREENGHPSLEFVEEEAEGEACTSVTQHVWRDVYTLIDQQSPPHKEILLLHFKQEYSPVDISRITEYSYAQIHQVILRFKNRLKELFRE